MRYNSDPMRIWYNAHGRLSSSRIQTRSLKYASDSRSQLRPVIYALLYAMINDYTIFLHEDVAGKCTPSVISHLYHSATFRTLKPCARHSDRVLTRHITPVCFEFLLGKSSFCRFTRVNEYRSRASRPTRVEEIMRSLSTETLNSRIWFDCHVSS